MIQPVRNRADLVAALERVRWAGTGPITNWFATPERLDYWIGRESIFLLEGERALLILHRNRGFHRVHHAAADLETLSGVLRSLNAELCVHGVLTTDLIGRPADVEPVAAIYRESGFADHNCLVRMIRMAAPGAIAEPEQDVGFAGPGDVEAVAAFLGRLLDPYTDRIPDEDEIGEAASRRNIILARRGESVAGLLLFENLGLTSHLRYWYVDGAARDQGIGARLIRQFFHLSSGSRRLILWVIKDNSDAIEKYRHYGFRPETLVDRIMIKRR